MNAKETTVEFTPEVARRWMDLILHATGTERSVPKSQRGYRNYYCADIGSLEFEDCCEMVRRGLMVAGRWINNRKDRVFHATRKGCEFAGIDHATIDEAVRIFS